MDPLKQNFVQHLFQEPDGSQWMLFDTFLSDVLRKHRVHTDKEIKRYNILRYFKGLGNGVRCIEDTLGMQKEAISLLSLLRFIFLHCEDFKLCEELSIRISNKAFKSALVSDGTLLKLYRVIAKDGLGDSFLKQLTLPNLVLDENSIASLYMCHKSLFSTEEWKMICLFEHHFTKYTRKVTEDRGLSIDEENEQKWKFYHQCCNNLQYENISIKTTIENRITRKKSADLDKTYHINALQIHLPEVLEIQLLQHPTDTSQISYVLL
jgi:hypothetical protein